MGFFDELPPLVPSQKPEDTSIQLFTANQVAAAVAAAVTAHAAGDDPKEAARAALTQGE